MFPLKNTVRLFSIVQKNVPSPNDIHIVCFRLVRSLEVVVGLRVQVAMVVMVEKQEGRPEVAMTTAQQVVTRAQLIVEVEEVV